ncbi:hypothetical protein HanXRQr2_Chr16g0727231 [Helianthus annuus]|uniref:Uncharacterized protein n=1 Tax=Helianthus annuus TaxID=4232 RepID=A0A9K3DQ95_HELAN|nr:hypothetical protein HanXRQr2_Chr16g0727231 [Helianthus annuus]
MGPCGFTFIVILAQNSKNPLFDCCKLPILSFNYDPWFDVMGAGLYPVILSDLKNTKEDYSSNK